MQLKLVLTYKEIEKLWRTVSKQPNTSNPEYLLYQDSSNIGTNTYCIRRLPLQGFSKEDQIDITDYSK